MADDELDRHWIDTMGELPKSVARLKEFNENYYAAYTDLRKACLEEQSDGLSLKHKELVLMVIDALNRHIPGAKRHVRAGLAAGLTMQELKDALKLIVLTGGILAWNKFADEAWSEALATTTKPPS